MIRAIDHIQIVAKDTQAAAHAYQLALGHAPVEAGGTFRFQTQNVSLRITPSGRDGFEGLSALAFAVDDLAEARRRLERRGVPSTLIEGAGPASAVIAPDASHGVRIALIEPLAQALAKTPTPADGLDALDHVVIRTVNVDRAVALLGARLGLDLRLDRTNPAWNARLLFFRCGEAVVELSADLGPAPSDAPDRLSGLAWRARDPDAARARMAAAGLEVSQVRPGRKAGTRVFTIRSGLVGGPCLVIASFGAEL